MKSFILTSILISIVNDFAFAATTCQSYLAKGSQGIDNLSSEAFHSIVAAKEEFWFLTDTLDLKEAKFGGHHRSMATYGVSKSAAIVIITSLGRKYLARVLLHQEIIDVLPELQEGETGTFWVFLGPRAIRNSNLEQSIKFMSEVIFKENSKFTLGLNSKFPYVMVNRNKSMDSESFNLFFSAEGLIYFKYK